MKQFTPLAINSYQPQGFVLHYQELVKKEVIPFQYDILCDKVENAEKSGVRDNFIFAAKALRGEKHGDFYGMVFQDSDAAKWLEAVAYSLAVFPDQELEKTADELIDRIADAQDCDGYLNTFFTVKDRDKRWTNLLEGHELYCAGHMMEAGCAYYEVTGKRKLLNVCLKNAQHIYDRFITGKAQGYPGHSEIELALMKMYRVTGEKFCLELAGHFVNVRGVDTSFFERECQNRTWQVWGMSPGDLKYNQSHQPVRQQTQAVGHSVRAVYLYTAMADLANETNDEELKKACEALFESITQKRMYITGGIGSTVHGEAFTCDYDLPGDTAYAETCASIGLMFFMSKMLEGGADSHYADIMERAFYNGVLSGMSLDGRSFFYVNPLEVIPGITEQAVTKWHIKTLRPSWYPCACCPPNLARLISSIGKYAYGENESTAFCHLYAAGKISFQNGLTIRCETEYPYGFSIMYKVESGEKTLAVRIPSWSEKYTLTKNKQPVAAKWQNGYAYIDCKKGDEILLTLDDKPYFVYASSKVPALTGKKAVMRGPLVYCFEGVDNENDILSLRLGNQITIGEKDSRLGGAVKLNVSAARLMGKSDLYSRQKPKVKRCMATAVPYYTWCNRGENQMRVWMDDLAESF